MSQRIRDSFLKGTAFSAVFVLLTSAQFVLAAARAPINPLESKEDRGYDSIVSELNREAERPNIRARNQLLRSQDPFETILFHGGVGLASLMQMVSFEDGSRAYLGQKGIQAAFGIDLFSVNWLAEGTARTFSESEETPHRVSLQEFELKLVYREKFNRQVGLRIGGGLSARYMNVRRGSETHTYTTPTGLGMVGIDIFISEKVSFGADINARNAMVTETPDKNSIDVTLRLDFHL